MSTESSLAELEIEGIKYPYWYDFTITLTLDSIDTVEFSSPFDNRFKPFKYSSCAVSVDETPIFIGSIIGVTPQLTERDSTISISAYSRPGVLGDCCPAVETYPIEYNGLEIGEIAESLASLFDIKVIADTSGKYERVSCDPTRKILDFLVELATQRNLLITNNSTGDLVINKLKESAPIVRLEEGVPPLLGVSCTFKPQQYYSHITGLESVVVGGSGSAYTVQNRQLSSVFRPFSFRPHDVVGGDIQIATENKSGRMIGSAVTYTVDVATWKHDDINLWKPGTRITLHAPSVMITEYELLIREVRLLSNGSASLTVIIPESLSGIMPERMPWD